MRPVALFVLLSAVFGTLTIAVNPPLRGPDEMGHFLRAYGIARGEILPSTEAGGRVGIYLPAELHDDFAFFETARRQFEAERFSYRGVLAEYMHRRASHAADDAERPSVFVPYEGTEGYTPAAYIPYIPAAFIARLAGLDFVEMVYLMRLAGLVAMTAVIAYAIAVTPYLKWAFFLIAMLPAALYGRSIISADGGTLAYTMAVTALCLNAAVRTVGGRAVERSVWMTLAVLSKPPQIAFVLLEMMATRLRDVPRRWRTLCLIVLPGLLLTPLWILSVSGEMAAWRIAEGTGLPVEQFDPVWKLGFIVEHPLHFPKLVLASLPRQASDLWHQLIGVLGWLDTPLRPWVYPVLSLLLLATPLEGLDLNIRRRIRIAAWAGLAIMAYGIGVYLIFFLTWTPTIVSEVWGLQGRYFLVVLPATAIVLAVMANRRLPTPILATAAFGGALISGIATVEAILRTNW